MKTNEIEDIAWKKAIAILLRYLKITTPWQSSDGHAKKVMIFVSKGKNKGIFLLFWNIKSKNIL